MLPLGAERAAKVAFRRGPATAMPRQFGPIRRAPWANKRKQLLLSLGAFAADLGEPGRDHDERSHALRSASSAASSTYSPGTEITAKSTGSGIFATEA